MIGITGVSSGLGLYLLQNTPGALAVPRGWEGVLHIDCLIHCAVAPPRRHYDFVEENLNLLRRLKLKHGTKVILISSVDAYRPTSEYGRMKQAVENFVRNRFKRNHLILRAGFLVGPSHRDNHLKKILRGADLTLSADSTFTYISYSSMQKRITETLNLKCPGTFNMASKHSVLELREVARKFGFTGEFGTFTYRTIISPFVRAPFSETLNALDSYQEIERGINEDFSIRS